jgi:hypothetical protein
MTSTAGSANQQTRPLRPKLQPGVYVFASAPLDYDVASLAPLALFREREGGSLIIEEEAALQAHLEILFRAAWLTLEVDSDLAEVGLTARVSTALAQAGIACNVVAAARHDHLFVPYAEGPRALGILQNLDAAS